MTEDAPSRGSDDPRPTPPDPGSPSPELRASDADRERVAEQLRDALAEGRLDMEEFEERLEAAFKARTYSELAPLTRDLPGAHAVDPVSMVKQPEESGSWAARIVGGEGSSSWGVAILSGFERKGRWTVPKRFNSVAFMGGGEIDLREANFADREVVVNVVAVMGGVNVIVPPGVEVVVRGIGIMGGFDHREEGRAGDPGAPRVIVTGFAFWGGVGVERKLTRAERLRLKEERRQEKLERKSARKELEGSRRDGLGDMFDALDDAHDLIRERHEERRERQEERRERHRERRDERHRRRHGGY
ncbi:MULTISPECIES: DUF1707 SHOCT-like domain-containing protein [Streptomyces]|uniref:DUF1707 SHOCT-like domain-containing protein n=1 Tax=Streptomyces TaxID=1883 RepID=UPI0011658941|nr:MULTISPECIES: DUF1707 domain-containing protein [unclassified Streptomyces]QDN78320.1 DUF1707 domain-containing protein [Streptomyces sp. S1A1-7]QDN98660.1 DUF1707 domain-containing protein [Streptomyces sp. RLB1-9]QDO20374.1 DUF1707 domain-containing protein [Streptomyces sp. S1A1-8]QDO30500.1 DUF1707 domain-containing protein [Streptomyces sp. S1A1-3]